MKKAFVWIAMLLLTANFTQASAGNEPRIIFSTSNMLSSKLLTPKQAFNKTSLRRYDYDDTVSDVPGYILLPKFKDKEIIIENFTGGDRPMYYLCVINKGVADVDGKKCLDVSPLWDEPGNEENDYSKKAFNIYDDYTIEINTDEKLDDDAQRGRQKYTKYYRINGAGEFYEVKK